MGAGAAEEAPAAEPGAEVVADGAEAADAAEALACGLVTRVVPRADLEAATATLAAARAILHIDLLRQHFFLVDDLTFSPPPPDLIPGFFSHVFEFAELR